MVSSLGTTNDVSDTTAAVMASVVEHNLRVAFADHFRQLLH